MSPQQNDLADVVFELLEVIVDYDVALKLILSRLQISLLLGEGVPEAEEAAEFEEEVLEQEILV